MDGKDLGKLAPWWMPFYLYTNMYVLLNSTLNVSLKCYHQTCHGLKFVIQPIIFCSANGVKSGLFVIQCLVCDVGNRNGFPKSNKRKTLCSTFHWLIKSGRVFPLTLFLTKMFIVWCLTCCVSINVVHTQHLPVKPEKRGKKKSCWMSIGSHHFKLATPMLFCFAFHLRKVVFFMVVFFFFYLGDVCLHFFEFLPPYRWAMKKKCRRCIP